MAKTNLPRLRGRGFFLLDGARRRARRVTRRGFGSPVFPHAACANFAPGGRIAGGFFVPLAVERRANTMMVKIECPECTHIGIVSAERLPAELRCWACGESRRVDSGARITNRAAVLEWLLGAPGSPRVTERKL
jgi:ribosomal protein S27E